ncbi:MAG: hypothetical protein WAQ28_14855 [Bacteroidia bacterium]
MKIKLIANVTAIICIYLSLLPQNGAAQSYSINTSGAIPDPSAMLDIIASDKGLLIPRVSLISDLDTVTITDPAVSLLVYNTNASMTNGGLGFWYWNGTQWIQAIGPIGITGSTGNSGVSK